MKSNNKEYEIIQHTTMNYLEVFLVEMTARNPHGHADLEIGMILNGSLDLIIDQRHFLLQKGDIYVINRYQVHSFLRNDTKNLILAFQIHFDLYKKLNSTLRMAQFPSIFRPSHSNYNELYTSLINCAKVYFSDRKYFELLCTSHLLNALYILSCDPENIIISESEYNSGRNTTLRLNTIIDYLAEHYTEAIRLKDIADLIHVTPYHASHFISRIMGVSFQEYLNTLRFEHALRLIEHTSLTLFDICNDSGISSTRYLNQMFQKSFGMSAMEYRKLGKKTALAARTLPAENIQKKLSYEAGVAYFSSRQFVVAECFF